MLKPLFGQSQIQDKPTKSLDQMLPDITFRKKIVQRTNAVEVKHHTTKQKPTEINAISAKQNTVLDGIETYSFTHGEAWARPGERGLGKAWRGPHISKIRL